MKDPRHLSQQLVRWTSLGVCFALVLTSFVLFPSQVSIGKNARSGKPSANSGVQTNGQERRRPRGRDHRAPACQTLMICVVLLMTHVVMGRARCMRPRRFPRRSVDGNTSASARHLTQSLPGQRPIMRALPTRYRGPLHTCRKDQTGLP